MTVLGGPIVSSAVARWRSCLAPVCLAGCWTALVRRGRSLLAPPGRCWFDLVAAACVWSGSCRPAAGTGGDFRLILTGVTKQNVALRESNPFNSGPAVTIRKTDW